MIAFTTGPRCRACEFSVVSFGEVTVTVRGERERVNYTLIVQPVKFGEGALEGRLR